jgi:hypothetical protein
VEIEPRGALLSFASLAQALGRIVPQAAIFTRTGVEGIPLPATYSRRKARRQLGFVLQIGLDEETAAFRACAACEGLVQVRRSPGHLSWCYSRQSRRRSRLTPARPQRLAPGR